MTQVSQKHSLHLTLEDIAKEVWVIGTPRRHPCTSAIEKWQNTFAEDTDWYPGKAREIQATRPGPKKKFSASMRHSVKRSAEALKGQGKEPTVDIVRERCPRATVNPDTG